jgi:hypothetical protein
MMQIRMIATASVVLLAFGARAADSPAKIAWNMQKFDKHLPGCDARPVRNCASVQFIYPEISGGPSEGRAEISSAVHDMLLTPIEKGKEPDNAEEFAAQILAHYQTWVKQGGDPQLSWTVERKIDVDYSSSNAFSIRLLERVEQGKTHAAKNTVYFNFRPEDGTLIQLAELIRPDRIAEFKKIAQRHFHNKDEKVPTGEDAKAPGQEFLLPKNFAIEKDGLRFRYEEDQVDAHSIRTPEFVVPYSEFRGLLQRGVNLP